MAAVIPVADVVGAFDLDEATTTALVSALQERDQAVADYLRIIGSNFGMYPQIVAEALAEVGLGLPLSTEERALIHSAYHQLINELNQQGNDNN